MEYPKKIMTIKELKELGWHEPDLRAIYRMRNQKIAWKMKPTPHSTILFDTDELEKYRKTLCTGL